MPEIRVPWRPAAGEVLVIEPEIDPITPISSLQVIPARTPGMLLTVRCLAPRAFEWRRISTGEAIQVGAAGRFEKPAGFEFDVFKTSADSRLLVVYEDPARDRMVVTRGFYLVDWPT